MIGLANIFDAVPNDINNNNNNSNIWTSSIVKQQLPCSLWLDPVFFSHFYYFRSNMVLILPWMQQHHLTTLKGLITWNKEQCSGCNEEKKTKGAVEEVHLACSYV